MSQALSEDALNQLFFEAQTHNDWQDKEVSQDLLTQVWDMARWGPTSMNCCPVRIVFVQSDEGKNKLKECLSEGNIAKTMKAPVTAIIGVDMDFFVNMPTLFPDFAGAADMFAQSPELCEETAIRNATLQGAYLIIACRALGLDCGPMSGFDNAKVDGHFFSDSKIQSNFLCNIGYGDKAGLYPRNPRPAFDEVCEMA